MLNLALFVVAHLVAVKMVVRVDHVNVRHPQAAQRHQIVSLVEALENHLFYVDVVLNIVENIICCVIDQVHWSETHLKRSLLMAVVGDVQLTLVAGHQEFGLHCILFNLPGKDGIVGNVDKRDIVVSLKCPFIW